MNGIEFVDPPQSAGGGRPGKKHQKIGAQLRANPGKWALVGHGSPSMAQMMKTGYLSAYTPKGSFEATVRKSGDDYDIYARYVGENGEHR